MKTSRPTRIEIRTDEYFDAPAWTAIGNAADAALGGNARLLPGDMRHMVFVSADADPGVSPDPNRPLTKEDKAQLYAKGWRDACSRRVCRHPELTYYLNGWEHGREAASKAVTAYRTALGLSLPRVIRKPPPATVNGRIITPEAADVWETMVGNKRNVELVTSNAVLWSTSKSDKIQQTKLDAWENSARRGSIKLVKRAGCC